jgi:hypothetical protein
MARSHAAARREALAWTHAELKRIVDSSELTQTRQWTRGQYPTLIVRVRTNPDESYTPARAYGFRDRITMTLAQNVTRAEVRYTLVHELGHLIPGTSPKGTGRCRIVHGNPFHVAMATIFEQAFGQDVSWAIPDKVSWSCSAYTDGAICEWLNKQEDGAQPVYSYRNGRRRTPRWILEPARHGRVKVRLTPTALSYLESYVMERAEDGDPVAEAIRAAERDGPGWRMFIHEEHILLFQGGVTNTRSFCWEEPGPCRSMSRLNEACDHWLGGQLWDASTANYRKDLGFSGGSTFPISELRRRLPS